MQESTQDVKIHYFNDVAPTNGIAVTTTAVACVDEIVYFYSNNT